MALAGCSRSDSAEEEAAGIAAAKSSFSQQLTDAERRFGLIVGGQYGMQLPPGVTCFTPGGRSPLVLRTFELGDVVGEATARTEAEARLHNLAVVAQPDYPDADVCRASLPDDHERDTSFPHGWAKPMSEPAREVARPVGSLHEAARRGSPGDVRRFLRDTPVNARDGLGLTPLMWAVGRNRPEIVDRLLDAGASPWTQGQRDETAFFWAAVLGHRTIFFDMLARVPGSPSWTRQDLQAALAGGDIAILRQILSDRHEMIQPHDLRSIRLSLPAARLLLETDVPGVADAVFQASIKGREPLRVDLMRLAISKGADVNAVGPGEYETPLGMVADGIYPGTPQAVGLLLDAGADPNALSHRRRPIWEAVGTMKLDGEMGAADARAIQILDLLLAAGGDINLPDYQGRPPVWGLFFPVTYDHDELDPSFVTKDLLTDLTARGLDLNAPSKGRRILSVIEEKAGPRSEYALWLRELGARP
ncbi:MAG: ankyrin repeat domain-containing protein [Brevundimonas sp.]|uniref:ankyrin repeat domain-containing protein n=1 Tax=Brevundimonas sp. TaxID=1871086 RepID=UPI001A2D7555|nr:ankyrin repeat domain-containing protein [Brevundimonas sp.]MBJ7446603.1 ankyrin repeat domain-containing protein [Brevundimonas sp.]